VVLITLISAHVVGHSVMQIRKIKSCYFKGIVSFLVCLALTTVWEERASSKVSPHRSGVVYAYDGPFSRGYGGKEGFTLLQKRTVDALYC